MHTAPLAAALRWSALALWCGSVLRRGDVLTSKQEYERAPLGDGSKGGRVVVRVTGGQRVPEGEGYLRQVKLLN